MYLLPNLDHPALDPQVGHHSSSQPLDFSWNSIKSYSARLQIQLTTIISGIRCNF